MNFCAPENFSFATRRVRSYCVLYIVNVLFVVAVSVVDVQCESSETQFGQTMFCHRHLRTF